MKRLLIALACLAFSFSGSVSVLAQAADEPASKDDVILYLRTMRSHDMFQQIMEVQSQNMQQLFRDQTLKERGSVPPEFDAHFKKAMDDMIKGMPVDEITQAMIPAYQKHFTKGDINAMNAFYSSPVGQKVLQELPVVMREGSQAAMPILSKYLDEWKGRMQQELKDMGDDTPNKPIIKKTTPAAPKPATPNSTPN
ncbi:MAG TPA: DUF2059 domain-containing protein [Candidatus Sulfotelmatobacter sp.]|nr:DUF2059 domain-containing protein [Candidatus Sulfotelmatobacter sp.]